MEGCGSLLPDSRTGCLRRIGTRKGCQEALRRKGKRGEGVEKKQTPVGDGEWMDGGIAKAVVQEELVPR